MSASPQACAAAQRPASAQQRASCAGANSARPPPSARSASSAEEQARCAQLRPQLAQPRAVPLDRRRPEDAVVAPLGRQIDRLRRLVAVAGPAASRDHASAAAAARVRAVGERGVVVAVAHVHAHERLGAVEHGGERVVDERLQRRRERKGVGERGAVRRVVGGAKLEPAPQLEASGRHTLRAGAAQRARRREARRVTCGISARSRLPLSSPKDDSGARCDAHARQPAWLSTTRSATSTREAGGAGAKFEADGKQYRPIQSGQTRSREWMRAQRVANANWKIWLPNWPRRPRQAQ